MTTRNIHHEQSPAGRRPAQDDVRPTVPISKSWPKNLFARAKSAIRYRLSLPRLVYKSFETWQRFGYHITPNHYSQPIPDTRRLAPSLWAQLSDLPGLEMREQQQIEMLRAFMLRYRAEYATLPLNPEGLAHRYYFRNGSFESVDAEILYCMIRHFRPKHLIEIGLGWSTLLSAEAIARNADEGNPCELISIDPSPSEDLHQKVCGAAKLIQKPVEVVPLHVFGALRENDILFIDSSHVVRIGGDVLYELLQVVPRLRKGVLIQLHDIFLPAEYPREWVLQQKLFYSEQYLLQAFLAFNRTYDVVWGGSYMHLRHPDLLEAAFPSYQPGKCRPGSLWMQKVA